MRSVTHVYKHSIVAFPANRCYGHSSYGGEGETCAEQPHDTATRDMEHPGPPAPETPHNSSSHSQHSSTSTSSVQQPGHHKIHLEQGKAHPETPNSSTPIPSNKARPTLNAGKLSPNIDSRGNARDDLPENVKKHNAEVEHRYGRAYNKIGDNGEVEQQSFSSS